MTHGVLLQVAYDGTDFHGWAKQGKANDEQTQEGKGEGGPRVRTVEETLRGALLALDPRIGRLRGSSRTDAGVHAEGQMVAFDTEREIEARGWVLGSNRHLPADVAVRQARATPPGVVPRFAARAKRYRYRMLVDAVRDPALRTSAWRLPALDVSLLRQEARAAVGTHDFAGFRASGDQRAVTVRTLTRIDVRTDDSCRIVDVVVEGNAFLYNMVRILVGTMADVARGRLPRGSVERALQERDRRAAGTTAPAHGLTLEAVDLDLPEGTGEPWPR